MNLGATVTHIESATQIVTEPSTRSNNQPRAVTLSSVLLAKRFSSTLLAPINKTNVTVANPNNPSETNVATKKQHNPRRHVFSTNLTTADTSENQNPNQAATTSGEKVTIKYFILFDNDIEIIIWILAS